MEAADGGEDEDEEDKEESTNVKGREQRGMKIGQMGFLLPLFLLFSFYYFSFLPPVALAKQEKLVILMIDGLR